MLSSSNESVVLASDEGGAMAQCRRLSVLLLVEEDADDCCSCDDVRPKLEQHVGILKFICQNLRRHFCQTPRPLHPDTVLND